MSTSMETFTAHRGIQVSRSNVGRIVGALALLHIVCGLMLPYILLNRVIGSPAFLENVVRNPAYVRAPALLFLFAGAITLGMSIAAYPVLREHSRRLALGSLGLGIANLPLQLVECGMVLSILSLSQDYSAASGADAAMLKTVAIAARSARRSTHYVQLLTVVSWIFVLFAALWRATLIPRVLAVIGLGTCALQIVGVPLRALLGYRLLTELAIPLGPAYGALGLWLLVKGFEERRVSP